MMKRCERKDRRIDDDRTTTTKDFRLLIFPPLNELKRFYVVVEQEQEQSYRVCTDWNRSHWRE